MKHLLPVAAASLLLALTAPSVRAEDAPPDARAPEAIARRFYDAFCTGDVATMEALYAPGVRFRDPIFAFEDRAGTMGMWRQLCDPKNGGRFSYELLGVEGEAARVRWVADYRFPPGAPGPLGRPVNNIVTATLVVKDGRIVSHVDDFSWERWARQALPLGRLSTWRPIERALKHTLRAVIARNAAKAEQRAGLAEAVRGE